MIHHSHKGAFFIALIDALLTGLNPIANGIAYKGIAGPFVAGATTQPLPAGTYANGTAGVGATFTVSATGTLTIDGQLTAVGDLWLVKNQASALQNGLYQVTTGGATGVSAVLTRLAGSDSSAVVQGQAMVCTTGTANAFKAFACFNSTAPTMGTTGIYFASVRMVHSQKTDALPQVLTDGTSIAFDASQGVNATLTIAGNHTLAFPTNLFPGAKGKITVTQDGTGSRTLAYGAGYKWAGGSAGTLSTAANAVDELDWYSPDGAVVHLALAKAFA